MDLSTLQARLSALQSHLTSVLAPAVGIVQPASMPPSDDTPPLLVPEAIASAQPTYSTHSPTASLMPPPLDLRAPLPVSYSVLLFVALIAPFFLPRGKVLRISATLPVVLFLVLSRPWFTAGTAIDDYTNANMFLGVLLAYVDLHILAPGSELRYLGLTGKQNSAKVEGEAGGVGVGAEDCRSWWQKLQWVLRLITNLRGVGWKWQVKNVPPNNAAGLSTVGFVRRHLLLAAQGWGLKTLALYCLGACMTLQMNVGSRNKAAFWLIHAAIGWCGGCWAYHGISLWYNFAAATTVAVGLCEPWEWPPVMGRIADAWSVRQMWGVVWHQLLRRRIEMITVRTARLLRLRKGTLRSRYLQLYVGFAVSMLIHAWCSFNSVRHDQGEFRFFMLQPVAITVEDLVQWCWRKLFGPPEGVPLATFEKAVGRVWTFAWFSYSLSPFVQGLLDGENLGAEWKGVEVMFLGSSHAMLCLAGHARDIFTDKSVWQTVYG